MSGAVNIIYGLIDPRTGFLRYVGKSTSGLRRPRDHSKPFALQHRTHTAAWIRSLARDGLKPEIAVLEETTREALFETEQFHIALMRFLGCDLTNQTLGGAGPLGWRMPEETKAKISAAMRGRVQTAEQRRLNAEAQRGNQRARGNRFSAESRARLSESRRGIPKSPEHRTKIAESVRRAKAVVV